VATLTLPASAKKLYEADDGVKECPACGDDHLGYYDEYLGGQPYQPGWSFFVLVECGNKHVTYVHPNKEALKTWL
jgi:hypothetical protein